MRLFTFRLLGLIVLAGVVGMASTPVVTFDALGQESDGTEEAASLPDAVSTATSTPASTTGDAPPEAADPDELEQVVLPTASADVEPLLPVSTSTNARDAAELSATETVPLAGTDLPSATAVSPSEAATETPVNAAAESATATSTAGTPATILAALDLDACEGSDELWIFALSNPVSLISNPDTIALEFTPGGSASAAVGFFSEDGGVFTSFYVSDQHLSDTLVSASAVVDSAISYTFVLTQGPTCPAELTSTPTETATGAPPTSTPTATQPPAAASTPTLTQDQEIISATIDLDGCEQSDDVWIFSLVNSVELDKNPDTITVHFIGGPSVGVSLGGSSEDGGAFTSFYFWNQNLDGAVQAAEAVVDASIDYAFDLISGPACAGDEPSTGTPTATASSTPTETATVTQTATATPSPTSTALSITPSPTNTATATSTNTATASATPTSTQTSTATATFTATPTVTATHPIDSPTWPTHTPGPRWTPTPPVGGLPTTGAGTHDSSNSTYGLLAIAGVMILGLAIRRRNALDA